MDIDELQTVQSKERQKDSLQHLRDSFYEDVAAYIEELKAERERVAEEADEPFSDPEVSRLSDDIERAEDVVEAIYERRVGKVVKMASFKAADMPVEEEGLTTQERDLFEDMVGRIGENRSRVLEILAGEGDSVPAGSPGAQPAPTETTATSEPASPATDPATGTDDTGPSRDEPAVGTGAPDPAGASGADESDDVPPAPPDRPAGEAETAGSEPPEASVDPRSDGGVATASADAGGSDAPASVDAAATGTEAETAAVAADDERTTVRVTEDVGRLLGVDDREYELESEDVVSLPADNAEALLQREAAEQLW